MLQLWVSLRASIYYFLFCFVEWFWVLRFSPVLVVCIDIIMDYMMIDTIACFGVVSMRFCILCPRFVKKKKKTLQVQQRVLHLAAC